MCFPSLISKLNLETLQSCSFALSQYLSEDQPFYTFTATWERPGKAHLCFVFYTMADETTISLLDEQGICLLSLDGGGVRGLSSLFVLKRIMDSHNATRKRMGEMPQKPCDVFDLIGGTSTGG